MRKILFAIIFFVLLCFTLPLIFTERPKVQAIAEENIVESNNTDNNEGYTYTKYGTVKLLHNETGEVVELPMEEYLYGVVAAEMPANYETEALKAQATVARTYTSYKILKGSKHEGADICDNPSCCQAWISKESRFEKWNEADRESNWNKITSAVNTTAGDIITYNGEPINAFFHSSSGGTTETVSNVWGGTDYPYLQSIETSGEEGYTQYSSSLQLTKEELIEKIKIRYPEAVIDFSIENPIQILEYTDSGRVKTIKFGSINISGVEAREIFGLKSAKFSIEIGENVIFNVTGNGHGVGLSQTGADAMAKAGATYNQIINHYYTDVKIEKL